MTTAQANLSPVRFMQHYVTNGTTKAKVHYSRNRTADGAPCVTIYAQCYSSNLGRVLPGYVNNSDSQTDYFDKGHVTLTESSPLYVAALARAELNEAKWEAHRAKVEAKRKARREARMMASTI